MNERIKQLAEQAGIKFSKDWGECYTGNVQLERFAELVRQDEREQAAQSDKLLIDLIQEQRAEIDRLRAAQPEQDEGVDGGIYKVEFQNVEKNI